MTTKTRVAVDAPYIKQQMKAKQLTPQIVMALAGYREIGDAGFNRMLREGSVSWKVAEVFNRLGIDYDQQSDSK